MAAELSKEYDAMLTRNKIKELEEALQVEKGWVKIWEEEHGKDIQKIKILKEENEQLRKQLKEEEEDSELEIDNLCRIGREE